MLWEPQYVKMFFTPWLNGCMPEQHNGGPPSEASGIVLRNGYHCHNQQEPGEFQVDSLSLVKRICVVPKQIQSINK